MWLRRTELVTLTTRTRQERLVRTHFKGTADFIEALDVWVLFNALCRQFKCTPNGSDFFCNLQRKSMRSGQTPQDFLLEIEGIWYMGFVGMNTR